jgi:MFS family permease
VLAPLKMSALGASGAGVAVVWLSGAALEAVVSPVVGRLSDRRGAMVPVRGALIGGAVLFGVLPAATTLPSVVFVVLLIAPTVGVLWAPAMALLSEGADAVHLDQGLAFALMNLSWAVGQFSGSAAGGSIAQATSDAVPEATLALTCAATLAVILTRARRPLAAVEVRR